MRNKLIFILTVSIATTFCDVVIAQYRPKQLDTLLRDLRKRGVDTILVYMQGAVWHTQIEPDTAVKSKCHCSFGNLIYAVNVIYKYHGKVYKLDYACCRETDTLRISKTLSIPYFLSRKQILVDAENAFYKNLRKTKKFPPPIATDYPWENVELIVGKKVYDFELNSYKSTDGYKIWKKYPWIDRQIKLIKLIRQDLGLSKE
ncbi:MAG TPA: hypothetical protein VHE59_01890 [Mucilaginibacter sp.]|nr:hypothetical protein [Mucilaginibacter sp.]